MTHTARTALLFSIVSLTMFPGSAAAQKDVKVTGTWNVHIQHFTGRVVDEQWIVEQHGNTVTGKVKTSTREFPLEGTVAANKINFKVTVTNAAGEEGYNIFIGTVQGESIKGDIKKANDDGTFSAQRAGS